MLAVCAGAASSTTAPLRNASNQAVENRIVSKARNEHHGRQILYFQSMVRFPSWTSPVRIRSPAPSFQQVRNTPLNHLLQFAPLIHAQAFSKALTASSRRSSEALV